MARRSSSRLPAVVDPSPALPTPPAADELRVLRESRPPSDAFAPLQDSALQLQDRQVVVSRSWASRGRDPAILPAWMVEAPIWLEPGSATDAMSLRRVYTGRYGELQPGTNGDVLVKTAPLAIEIQNTIKRVGPARYTGSPSGLLRHGDLDVVIAIMQQCLGRRTREIEYETGSLLAWLGKDPAEYSQAYRALRGSIARLTSAQIVIYLDGLEQDLPIEELPAPFTILVNDGRRQERGVIRGAISDFVSNDITRGNLWQLIDVKAYRHLLITLPNSGITRVIYLFLSSLRQKDSTFSCPTAWLQERYGERLNGQYRYASPYAPRSRVYRALKELADSSVVNFAVSDDGTRLSGSFADTTILPELPARRSRHALPVFGVEQDVDRAPLLDLHEKHSEVPQRSSKPSTPIFAQPMPAISSGGVATTTTDSTKRKTPDPIRASIDLLNADIKCNRTKLTEARVAGWSEHEILHAMIDVLHGHAIGLVIRPGGLLASHFTERESSAYANEPVEAVAWLYSAPKWRELPWLKVRRAAAVSRKAALDAAAITKRDAPAAKRDAVPEAPPAVRPVAPPDLVTAWHYTLRQVESTVPPGADGKTSSSWFDRSKVLVLALEDGWLLVEVPNALYKHALSTRFGPALALTMAEALDHTAVLKGITLVAKGSATEVSGKSVQIPVQAPVSRS